MVASIACQQGCGGAPFNNLLQDSKHENDIDIDFAAHAASLGATAKYLSGIPDLEHALSDDNDRGGVRVYVIDTTPEITTDNGDVWWDVAVPEVSQRSEVSQAHEAYKIAQKRQKTIG